MSTKYIFVTGGVTSSLGKGIIAASLGRLIKEHGYNVTIIKMDPYLNIDPGTMSPYEHGECFVTSDGAETDLDLGHYERFLNQDMSSNNTMTMGRIYDKVLTAERRGQYLGKTVQVIPHITDQLKNTYLKLEGKYDVVIVEIGGCVGDIESTPFIEAVRQTIAQRKRDTVSIHLTLVPRLTTTGEQKTKPSQQSVKELRSLGVQPDFLITRSDEMLSKEICKKLSIFCAVSEDHVIQSPDCDSIYRVPNVLLEQNFDTKVLDSLSLVKGDLKGVKLFEKVLHNQSQNDTIKVALLGKYSQLEDAYKSIFEALSHAGSSLQNPHNVKIDLISPEGGIEDIMQQILQNDALLIGPGFGSRGMNLKIAVISRMMDLNSMPVFGICLGMQCMVIAAARKIKDMEKAHTTESEPSTPHPVIDLMSDQKNKLDLGGTMRLGQYECVLQPDSLASSAYNGLERVSERHRHRYEMNPFYTDLLLQAGLSVTGHNPDTDLAEIVEWNKGWIVGTQFHPEYKSRPEEPHPLFVEFLKKSLKFK